MFFEVTHDAFRAALRQDLIMRLASGAIRMAPDLDDHLRVALQRRDAVVESFDRVRQQFRRIRCEMDALQLDLVLDGAADRIDAVALGCVRTLIDRIGHTIAVAVERQWWWWRRRGRRRWRLGRRR